MFIKVLLLLSSFTIIFAATVSKMADNHKLPDPVELSYLKIDGEDPNKSPVLIYHGIFGSKADWAELGKNISRETKRKVYCFDVRDHGESPWTEDFSLNAAISDMHHFTKVANISRAVFIGHSLGGMILSRFVTLFPEMSEKLVIVDINPVFEQRDVPKPGPNFMKLFALFLKKTVETIREEKITDLESAKKRLQELLKDKKIDDVKEYSKRLTIRNGQVDWQFHMDELIKFMDKKEKELVPYYKGTAIEIYGGKSMLVKKEDMEILLKHMPNIEFKCVENAGHNLHVTHSKEFLEILIPFLNS